MPGYAPPPPDDPLWREAQPLVTEALDDFRRFDELQFSTSSSSLVVASSISVVLQLAAARMRPVFEEAGWGYKADIQGGLYRRIAFTHPHTLARTNLRIVR